MECTARYTGGPFSATSTPASPAEAPMSFCFGQASTAPRFGLPSGKPTDNAFVESFNGTFRDECLNVYWFETLAETKQLIEAWRQEYNGSRPHRALKDGTPTERVRQ